MADQQAPPTPAQQPPAQQPPVQQPPAQPMPPTAPQAPSAMTTMLASMSQWEMFIVAGALVLVLGDLLFGVLLREFYAGDVIWLAAAIALLAFWAQRRRAGSVPMYTNVMLLAAAVVALLGARDAVIEIYYLARNASNLTNGAVYLLAVVAWFVGVALVAWGGWLLWRHRPAA